MNLSLRPAVARIADAGLTLGVDAVSVPAAEVCIPANVSAGGMLGGASLLPYESGNWPAMA